MSFPSSGSWISGIQTGGSLVDQLINLNFVAAFTTGSSNVEYAVYDTTNATPYIDYTTATNGSNSVNITGSVLGRNYRVHFRMIGYPGVGYNPVVSAFNISQTNTGAQIQTTNVGSDIQLSTTKLTKAMVLPNGSFYWQLTGSVSSDNGTTWTPIPSFGTEFSITSTTGSEPVIKLTDQTGSVVLDRIEAYFHTSDIS